MTMLNLLGITRFIELGPWTLAVGVLPYPITFLCTDLVSELYGRRRANFLVTFGLCLNFFILGFMVRQCATGSRDPSTLANAHARRTDWAAQWRQCDRPN